MVMARGEQRNDDQRGGLLEADAPLERILLVVRIGGEDGVDPDSALAPAHSQRPHCTLEGRVPHPHGEVVGAGAWFGDGDDPAPGRRAHRLRSS